MRLSRALGIYALLALCPLAAHAANEIVADPPAVTTGQTTTLKWYFTGDKVTVSGGRFGKGTVVTGRQKLTDSPAKTTHYTFDVYYRAPASQPGGATPITPLHARYEVVVNVVPMPPVSLYHAACGWQVNYLSSWHRDSIAAADRPKDGLVYFQPEDDAVERLAVAVIPAKNMTVSDVMQQVQADMPSRYNQLEILSHDEITYQNAPAIYTTFAGVDISHPDTRTSSVVLIFVRDNQAYVVSARTAASRFKDRRPILERMVKSFAVGIRGAATRTASVQSK